jgi:hypothetical protein
MIGNLTCGVGVYLVQALLAQSPGSSEAPSRVGCVSHVKCIILSMIEGTNNGASKREHNGETAWAHGPLNKRSP